jgi:hypothetical protein
MNKKLLRSYRINNTLYNKVLNYIDILNYEKLFKFKSDDTLKIRPKNLITVTSIIHEAFELFIEKYLFEFEPNIADYTKIPTSKNTNIPKFTFSISGSESMIKTLDNNNMSCIIDNIDTNLFKNLLNSNMSFLYNPVKSMQKAVDCKFRKPILYKSKEIKDLFKNIQQPIISDSGALQAIRFNSPFSEKEKSSIYSLQKYSTMAFNFDIAQIKVVNNIGYYNSNLTAISGKKSGENIRRQIDYFIENKIDTKVSIIIHANTSNDFIDYYNSIIQELRSNKNIPIKEDKVFLRRLEQIKSLSTSDTTICDKSKSGTAYKISKMVFDLHKYLKKNNRLLELKLVKNIHCLGVGSATKLIPFSIIQNRTNYLNSITLDASTFLDNLRKGIIHLPYTKNEEFVKTNKTKGLLSKDIYQKLSLAYNIVKNSIKEFINNREEFILYSDYRKFSTKKRIEKHIQTKLSISPDYDSFPISKMIDILYKKALAVKTSLQLLNLYTFALQVEGLFSKKIHPSKFYKSNKIKEYLLSLDDKSNTEAFQSLDMGVSLCGIGANKVNDISFTTIKENKYIA